MNNTYEEEKFERCVMCGALTCIPIFMPIDMRENYIIGCGQICTECAKKLQGKSTQRNTLSYNHFVLAVEQSKK